MERTCSSEGILPGKEAGSIPRSSTEKMLVRASKSDVIGCQVKASV
jgi:hypothetical protein